MIDTSDNDSPSIFRTYDVNSYSWYNSASRTQDISQYSSLKDSSEFKLMKWDIPKPKGWFIELFK